MANASNPHLYHPISRLLHWVSVPLFIAVLMTGLDLESFAPRSPEKLAATALHVSLGATLATMLILRLIWRGIKPPPPIPTFIDERRRKIARISHVLLYVLLFAQIILGDLTMLTVTDIVIWDTITIPTPFERDIPLHKSIKSVHQTLWYGVVGLIVIHVIAAVSLYTKADPDTKHSAFRM